MKSFHDEAIVLRKHSVKEKDEVIVLLTKRQGKMAFMSYGSRDPKSRKAGVVEIFNTIAFEARQGKLNLPVLQQAKPLKMRAFGVVHEDHQDLSIFYRASAMLKCVNENLQDLHSVQNVYIDLSLALDSVHEPLSELIFRVKFLDDMGLLSDLSVCCICQKSFKESDTMCFVEISTGFAHRECCRSSADNELVIKPVDSSSVKLMKYFQKASFEEGIQVSVDETTIQQMLDFLSHVDVFG
jgi:DNA repair protein RecO